MGFIDRLPLLESLRAQFQINWMGHHGIAHWARVRANGLMLAQLNGANPHFVELFAWFHDSRRGTMDAVGAFTAILTASATIIAGSIAIVASGGAFAYCHYTKVP